MLIAAAWACLLSPLVGALTITIAGGRISRRAAGWIATLSTFIAFARQQGDLDGQIFALAVMAVAAAEVAIGLGLIVAMARRRMLLDVDQASALRG